MKRMKGFILTGLVAFWGVVGCLTAAAVQQVTNKDAPAVQETQKNYNLK